MRTRCLQPLLEFAYCSTQYTLSLFFQSSSYALVAFLRMVLLQVLLVVQHSRYLIDLLLLVPSSFCLFLLWIHLAWFCPCAFRHLCLWRTSGIHMPLPASNTDAVIYLELSAALHGLVRNNCHYPCVVRWPNQFCLQKGFESSQVEFYRRSVSLLVCVHP